VGLQSQSTRARRNACSWSSIKNQKEPEPELSLKFRIGAEAMTISEVALALGPFLDINIFAKQIYFI